MPFSRLSLLALSGLFTAIVFIELGIKYALITYSAAAIAGLLILPSKDMAIGFAVFFGWYPILKSYIEGLNKLIIEWALKLVIFNIVAVILYNIAKSLFELKELPNVPIWAVWIGLNILFLMYDYGLSILITYYNKRFRGKIIK